LDTFESFEGVIYQVNGQTFSEIALRLFRFQAGRNPIYRNYLAGLGIDPMSIRGVEDIPFLPIAFFKTKSVKTGEWDDDIVFSSSGTTGKETSRHHLRSRAFYAMNATKCFNSFFGRPEDFVMLAMLPSYLERSGSSLVFMIDHFIKAGARAESGFILRDHAALVSRLQQLKTTSAKVIVWGVTFALLEFAEEAQYDIGHCVVIETGGMKGRRAEITREELHTILRRRLNVGQVCSEYGMTELLSQAYSRRDGIFETPPWMKVVIRDPEDPLARLPTGRVGGINVIDLANIHSCAFVETQDLGRSAQDGTFEVLGRLDNSDIRGCNLLG
jgi:phenylacetate-coenzyme A ligase PaaK-like adenylate-forming protein